MDYGVVACGEHRTSLWSSENPATTQLHTHTHQSVHPSSTIHVTEAANKQQTPPTPTPPPPSPKKTNMKLEIQARGQREQYKDRRRGIIHKAPALGERQPQSSQDRVSSHGCDAPVPRAAAAAGKLALASKSAPPYAVTPDNKQQARPRSRQRHQTLTCHSFTTL